MKFVSVDIETTGLDVTAKDSMILSVGMIVDDLENPLPYEELPKIHVMVDVTKEVIRGDIVAINMNAALLARIHKLSSDGFVLRDLEDTNCEEHLAPYQRAGDTLMMFLRKHFNGERITFAGKNLAGFDIPFIKATWPLLFEMVPCSHSVLDPAILYMLPSDKKVPSLSLCKERAGFADTEVAHDALADAWDVCRLLRHKFSK